MKIRKKPAVELSPEEIEKFDNGTAVLGDREEISG